MIFVVPGYDLYQYPHDHLPTPKQLAIAAEEVMSKGEYYANAKRMATMLSKYQAEMTVAQTVVKLVQGKLRYTPATSLST